MAEANPASDHNQDSGIKSEFHIADCSICLEQLRKPKSLPCLHTFCQDCLSTFITSNGSSGATQVFFNCPVCRRRTLPIEPSSTTDLWASQFPTNNFVIEIMKKINPNDKNNNLCQPCLQLRNTEVPAACWCQDCGHFMCASCIQSHDLVFKHNTMTMDELSHSSAVLIPVKSNCEKHGKNIEFICLDHTLLCCYVCIAIDHRKCDNVSTVIEYAEFLKSKDKEKLTKLAQDIDKNVSSIDCTIAEFREKLNVVATDKDTALEKLSDVRKWFDTEMSRMSDEVMKTYKVETEKIQRTLDDMETVRSSLLQTKAMSNTTQQTGQEHQLVSTVIRGKSEIERCEQIVKNKPDETVRIQMKFKDEFDLSITKKQEIGTVIVSKEIAASCQAQKTKALFGRTAKQIRSITVPGSGTFIGGFLVLPTGHLIVPYHFGQQLLYITESGDVLSTLKLDGYPWDMCQTPDGDIAVSVFCSSKIIIVRLSSSQLSLIRTIQLTELPRGITFFDGALHVTTDGQRLYKVSESGQLKQLQRFNACSYYLSCSILNNQLVGSLNENTPGNTFVYRVSRDNTYTEVIKADIVKGARGIDVDDEDNIYVCGWESNNVLQISADGSTTRELLTSNDVSNPYMITVIGDKIYVCENSTRILKIYKLE